MSDKLSITPISKEKGMCSACQGVKRVSEIRASSHTIRFCQSCALKIMSAFASLYGVEPVQAISDTPELLEEFIHLREQLNEVGATMRRLQAYVTQGN